MSLLLWRFNETPARLWPWEKKRRMIGRTREYYSYSPHERRCDRKFRCNPSMLKYFILKALKSKSPLIRPRVVISVPSGVTAVEERAVREQPYQQGKRGIFN